MDVAKIFDFGLSRTLDPSCRVDAESQDTSVDDAKMKKNQSILYKMTGMTGPLRYMVSFFYFLHRHLRYVFKLTQ